MKLTELTFREQYLCDHTLSPGAAAREFCERWHIHTYEIESNGTINAWGNVSLNNEQMGRLPVKFGTIKASSRSGGDFYAIRLGLTTLEGFPSHVARNLSFSGNPITSLDGLQVTVNYHVEMSNLLELRSLHNVHKHIQAAEAITFFNTPITSHILGLCLIKNLKELLPTVNSRAFTDAINILNKHLGKGRVGVLAAQQELLDAGLDDYAQL